MEEKKEIEKSASTEQKIKEAAARVFTRKGYAATRTRDIAEESGYNLSLINYYFRSKEKLFDIIMLEHIQTFVHSVLELFNDQESSLEYKIETIVSRYIDLLIQNPDIPIFILSEIKADPGKLIDKVGINERAKDTFMAKQWAEMVANMGIKINPVHIMVNIAGMIVFPFVGSPIIRNRTGMTQEQFNQLMEERKKLIPIWIKGIIGATRQAGL